MSRTYQLQLSMYQDGRLEKLCSYDSATDKIDPGYDLSYVDAQLFMSCAKQVREVHNLQKIQERFFGCADPGLVAKSPPPPAPEVVNF